MSAINQERAIYRGQLAEKREEEVKLTSKGKILRTNLRIALNQTISIEQLDPEAISDQGMELGGLISDLRQVQAEIGQIEAILNG